MTLDMETLQLAYVSALTAAIGCQMSNPRPDTSKIDVAIYHNWSGHTGDTTAEIRAQLKATYQINMAKLTEPARTHFSFTLDNQTLNRLNQKKVTIQRLLFVMVMPPDPELWTSSMDDHLALAHHCYYVNLRGVQATGIDDTNIRVPLANRLTAESLNEVMLKAGRGETI